MLKLNASFSKKVPAEQEYSSKGYSATIEVELPEGLSQEQLKDRIHNTFKLVETSVEAELNGTITDPPSVNSNRPNTNLQSNVSSGKNQNSKQATSKQVKFLTDLARQKNISLYQHLKDFGYSKVSELRFDECSLLINKFIGLQAA